MSWVSEIKDICGDYMIDIKYHEEQKEAITLFFNSRRNAETVKRCIELDDSVPNVATAVDFVEVVRCGECRHKNECNQYVMRCGDEVELAYCSHGERREDDET